MKKKILLICTLVAFTFGVFALKVNAANSARFDISCGKTTIAPGESLTCDIIGTSDEELSGVRYTINVSDGLTFSGTEGKNGFRGQINKNVASFAAEDFVSSGSVVATVSVSAKSDAQIGSTQTISLSDGTIGGLSGDVDNLSASVKLTIGESSGSDADDKDDNQQGGGSNNIEEAKNANPKTMDLSTTIILTLLAGATFVVVVGKKKLSRLSK